MTMDISADLAASLGRSELANEPIGLLLVEGVSRHVGGVSDGPVEGGESAGGVLDVKLGELYGLRSYGHEGTYPNGASGLACATTSCNPGDVEVDWYAPMDERHPAIGMHLYRLYQGRFEQIGASWLKHGFFALSNNQCGDPRGCSGTDGTRLGHRVLRHLLRRSQRRSLLARPERRVEPLPRHVGVHGIVLRRLPAGLHPS